MKYQFVYLNELDSVCLNVVTSTVCVYIYIKSPLGLSVKFNHLGAVAMCGGGRASRKYDPGKIIFLG